MFKHPTGREPKSIHIVCCGATVRDYIAANMQYTVTLPEADEVWTLNKAFRSIKADFGFILDDLAGERAISNQYWEFICKLTHTTPIITSHIDPTIDLLLSEGMANNDNVFEYPIKQVRNAIGEQFWKATNIEIPAGLTEEQAIRQKGNSLLYFKNSVPMILAYAWFIGVEQICLFGADYTHPSGQAREADQPNAEYWLGWCEALGINLLLPGDTTLKSTREGRSLYGYGTRQPEL